MLLEEEWKQLWRVMLIGTASRLLFSSILKKKKTNGKWKVKKIEEEM